MVTAAAHPELSWRGLIRANMARAQEHRLHSEWEQVRRIDLVLALGCDFEDNPRLAPLRAILEGRETNGQTRVMRCYAWLDNRGAP